MPTDTDNVIFGGAATVLTDTNSAATISLGGVVTFDTFVDSVAQDITLSSIGNTTNVWGGTLGASTGLGEHTVAGLSFTYANSDTRVDKSMGKAESDAYYIDLFARYRKDNWNIIGVVTGGFTSMDLERDLQIVDFSSSARASADGNQIMGLLQAGYEFTLSREYFVNRDTVTRGRFEARAIVLQDLAEVEGKVDANFIGLPGERFNVQGITPGRTSFIIGVSLLHPLSENLSLFADVDGEFRSDANGVGGTLGLRYSF